MLFYLSYLTNVCSWLNIFRYITFRSIAAVFTSFFVVFFLGPVFIRSMKRFQKQGQPIRSDGPERHLLCKKQTPTMGGGLILVGFLVSFFLWADLRNPYVHILTFVYIALNILGGVDDYIKVTRMSSRGISARSKLIFQMLIVFVGTFCLMWFAPSAGVSTLMFPFFKKLVLNLGGLYVLWATFVTVGASNAVNLTDGLDGLAVGPVIISCAFLSFVAYMTGHSGFSSYLHLPLIPEAGELMVLGAAMIGACFGFLWYNSPPAMIFMGDMGSLALGGFLGFMSLMIKQEFLFALVGGVFVIEVFSVIAQVLFFKKTGRRIFLMAPLHHHFEQKGWPESTVVLRFWIVSILLGLLALLALKVR